MVVDLVSVCRVASGSGPWKGYAVAAGVVVIVLATTGVWNPFPRIWNWMNTSDPIAAGAAQWQQRIGGSPQSVTIANDAVIVAYRTSVEAYGLGAAVRLWQSDADWAAVAGTDPDAVVVTGRLLTKGYQVLDPRTGAVRRQDTAATAVWTYQNAILDLHCAKGNDCELTAWDPRGSRPLWTVSTGGIGFVFNAANPDLPDTQPLTSPQVDDNVAGPELMPSLIGLPEDGKIRIVDTAGGKVVQTAAPGPDQRVAVAGGRVLTVTGTARDGTCYYGVVATDPPSGQRVWARDGLNLRTAGNGSACKQDRDPVGGSDVVLGVDPVGRRELLAAHDGRVLWHGSKADDVLAVDDGFAVIRSGGGDTLVGRSFDGNRTVWRRSVGAGATAALTPYAAIVAGTKPSRITAMSRSDGTVLADLRTDARVFAVGPHGLIVVSGRDMAYLPFR
jgi:outer membrane protein assembly factor BamB